MINIHIHHHYPQVADVLLALRGIREQGVTIMGNVVDLQTKFTALRTTILSEREEVQTLLNGLKAEIQALKDQIATGIPVTQSQLDGFILQIDEFIPGVAAISEPVAPPVA